MRRLLLAYGVLLALIAPVRAEERIASFISDVTVQRDASITVTETISVAVEGKKFKHGILRHVPARTTDSTGRIRAANLYILSVERDGQPERYAVESSADTTTLRVGKSEVLLEHRIHQYKIVTRRSNQLLSFPASDGIIWDCAGSWDTSIDRLEVVIRLPVEAAPLGTYAKIMGLDEEQTAPDITIGGNIVKAKAGRPLRPGERLIVGVQWKKGITRIIEGNEL